MSLCHKGRGAHTHRHVWSWLACSPDLFRTGVVRRQGRHERMQTCKVVKTLSRQWPRVSSHERLQ
eukprot:8082615-Alexandrium_andersonii.AAC.1